MPRKRNIFLNLTLVGLFLLGVVVLSQCCKVRVEDTIRADTLMYLRSLSAADSINDKVQYPSSLDIDGGWTVYLILYDKGIERAKGMGKNSSLGGALLTGFRNTLYADDGTAYLTKNEIDRSRFHVALVPSYCESSSFIEYSGRACELVGDVVAVRTLTKSKLAAQIMAGKEYLLRMMDVKWHAFFKSYDVQTGTGENRLRTIYTASSLYTFLKISGHKQDDRINEAILPVASFLMSMQVTEGKHKGAFYYSFFPDSHEKENRFVVGTASKTIFTLIMLYNKTHDEQYLNAAQAAGNWLLSMQREDGIIYTYAELRNGTWYYGDKFSCLYTGQVLSALSRLYGITHDTRYLKGAGKIALILSEKARQENYFLNDDYRYADSPIPTSWAVMSLLDYFKVTHDMEIQKVLQLSARELLKRQKKDPRDILNLGRFAGTLATSGNGWINEVLGELYTYGNSEEWPGCEEYKEAMILVSRWLIQNTYSPENSYFLEQPEKAYGGLIRNQSKETVRTDAVCHGVNGYIMLYDALPDDFHIEFK